MSSIRPTSGATKSIITGSAAGAVGRSPARRSGQERDWFVPFITALVVVGRRRSRSARVDGARAGRRPACVQAQDSSTGVFPDDDAVFVLYGSPVLLPIMLQTPRLPVAAGRHTRCARGMTPSCRSSDVSSAGSIRSLGFGLIVGGDAHLASGSPIQRATGTSSAAVLPGPGLPATFVPLTTSAWIHSARAINATVPTCAKSGGSVGIAITGTLLARGAGTSVGRT